jgi:tetratricopeptide (TPR) repeat protein
MEAYLLGRMENSYGDTGNAAWELVKFYSLSGRHSKAVLLVEWLYSKTDNLETQAILLMSLGQLMEQISDFNAAIDYYRQAYALEPVDRTAWYFIHNNLGYCLNLKGLHGEAECYCREAIKIDPRRYNAHKNLGISYQGQGEYRQAARCFVQSTHLEPRDRRAYRHLLELVTEQEWLLDEMPELNGQIEACYALIEAARSRRKQR